MGRLGESIEGSEPVVVMTCALCELQSLTVRSRLAQQCMVCVRRAVALKETRQCQWAGVGARVHAMEVIHQQLHLEGCGGG